MPIECVLVEKQAIVGLAEKFYADFRTDFT